ncbi:MAG: tetratricopeptide repeat protein [Deltaproteobacteria bacterium]|nr:tetratricopeptide repeat protein [Deltaproteobacteria bacterium]
MKPTKPFFCIVLVLALPLLLSYCDKQQRPGTRPDLSSRLQESISAKSANDLLPPERMEALGEIALQSGDYDSSLINFLEILKKDPQRYDLHYKVGVIFLLKGQLEPAQNELALVLVHRPEMTQAHEALGMVHLQQKKYPQALGEFQAALSQDSGRANPRHLLGITYLEAGQPGKAVVELKRALDLDRRHIPSYVALGQAYTELKDYRRAVDCLKQGLSQDPTSQKLNYQLGMALAGEKRYNEALEAFMKAGDEAQAYNNIGVHYFVAGQFEEAAKCFQRAIELRPTFYGEAKTNLQRALEKLHQVRKDDG